VVDLVCSFNQPGFLARLWKGGPRTAKSLTSITGRSEKKNKIIVDLVQSKETVLKYMLMQHQL
jgi:hypothetical protein